MIMPFPHFKSQGADKCGSGGEYSCRTSNRSSHKPPLGGYRGGVVRKCIFEPSIKVGVINCVLNLVPIPQNYLGGGTDDWGYSFSLTGSGVSK